jgi:signal transduction histidine kinase
VGDRERSRAIGRELVAGMSPARARATPVPLPPPLPADLVEARPAWPQLDDVELEHLEEHADALADRGSDEAGARVSATIVGGAAAARLALEERLTAVRTDELVAWAAARSGTEPAETRLALFQRALLDVLVAAPSRARAVEALRHCLCAFAPVTEARLEPLPDAAAGAIPIADCDLALVAEVAPGAEAVGRAYAEETARVLGAARRLGSSGRDGVGEKLAAAQRRLRRLSLDLHDGPAQDVAALAADAALLEADLADPERLDATRELAADIRVRLAALGRDIRDLAEVLEPRAILRAPLREVLEREAAAFARRAGFAPTLEVDDDLGAMTASQQIALARVAREALTNIRDHAEATAARVTATATSDGVSLVVTDDGKGFDPERGDDGGLGLAGMHDRVRLLGGRLVVESRPGGPTRVAATLPRWRPSG